MASDTDVDAGKLDKRLLIEQDVGTTLDSAGQHVESWQAWSGLSGSNGYVWAGIRQLSGREIERAAMSYAEATHLIWGYWVNGLTPVKLRGKLGSRVFNFGSVNNVNEANIKFEILACERIA